MIFACRIPIWGEEGGEGTGDDGSIVSSVSVKNLCPSGITGEDAGELERGESKFILRMSAADVGEPGGDSIAPARDALRGAIDRVGGVRPGGMYPVLCTATRPLFRSNLFILSWLLFSDSLGLLEGGDDNSLVSLIVTIHLQFARVTSNAGCISSTTRVRE